jgi:hypothetical protein
MLEGWNVVKLKGWNVEMVVSVVKVVNDSRLPTNELMNQ